MKIPIYILAVLILLIIPFLTMQFTNQVQWGFFDFIVMGILLIFSGYWTKKVVETINSKPKKLIFISLIIITFFLLWFDMAVGIFNSPISGS